MLTSKTWCRQGAMLGFSISAKSLSYAPGASLSSFVGPFMSWSLTLHKEADGGERIYLSLQFQILAYHYNNRKVKMACLWDSWAHPQSRAKKNEHMHVPLLFLVLILTSLLIRFRTNCLGNDVTHSGLLTLVSLSHSPIDTSQAHQIDKSLLRLSS